MLNFRGGNRNEYISTFSFPLRLELKYPLSRSFSNVIPKSSEEELMGYFIFSISH